MLKRFGVSIDEKLLSEFDAIIQRKGYYNRSEAIRDLIRDFILNECVKEDGVVYGTITFVYDHEEADVIEKLVEIQHLSRDMILATTHVHLNENLCLETLIVKGEAKKIKILADKIISNRGVKNLKYAFVTPVP